MSVGTVTAQLLYEIGGPRYLNPDVTARFDTIRLDQAGQDRVRVSGVRGAPPPADLKVALNYAGGYRNSMILAIEGLDVAAKAELAERAIWARIEGGRSAFDTADVDLVGSDPALLRISVLDKDKARVGRAFSSAVVETALASYPGFYALTPPGDASAYGVYWPTAIPADLVATRVLIDGAEIWSGPARVQPHGRRPAGTARATAGPPRRRLARIGPRACPAWRRRASRPQLARSGAQGALSGHIVRAPLGAIVGARSGDKGGNANLGVWVRTAREYAWLDGYLTAERLAELVPSVAGFAIERYRLPNLLALNFVIIGLLGAGVAASTRLDAQAKALGEELRAATAAIPTELVTAAPRAEPVVTE